MGAIGSAAVQLLKYFGPDVTAVCATKNLELAKNLGANKVIFPMPVDIPATLALIRKLMEEGHFKPVLDREYPLERIVEAYKYVEKGQKTGNVVITVNHGPG